MTELNRILCVDDNVDILTITKFTLESMGGFTVMTCESAKEALENAESFDPELFVLDVMMPEIDGPTLFRKLRALPKWQTIPIMFMTAKCQAHEVAKLMELGAIGVVPKPFDPVDLSNLIMDIWNTQEPGQNQAAISGDRQTNPGCADFRRADRCAPGR